MKRIVTLISLLTLVALASSSCIAINIKAAKGEVVGRNVAITEDITAVAASSGIDVIVDPTLPRGEVRILTHTDVQDLVVVEVEGSSLNIKLKSISLSTEVLKVFIPAYEFNAIATSAGSDFEWTCCDVPSLTVAASGGSDIEIKGRCKVLTATASSGADLDLEELIADNVTLAASSGSDAHVHATSSLTVNASSGADVTYSGNPEHTDINSSSGAGIRREK